MEWQQSLGLSACVGDFLEQCAPAAGETRRRRRGRGRARSSNPKIADRHLAPARLVRRRELSFGDIVMGCIFWRYEALDCVKPDIPHLMEWLEALKRREPYRQWVMVPVGRNVGEWAKYEKELG
jgi:glutathione S-transferase